MLTVRVLLLIDNCEHLLAACAGLAQELLHACPSLRILTTSREPLGLTGERVLLAMEEIPVPPLDPRDRIGGHLGVMQDFVAAVNGGPPPETSGSDNAKSLAMVFGAIESAESGRRVQIDTAWS